MTTNESFVINQLRGVVEQILQGHHVDQHSLIIPESASDEMNHLTKTIQSLAHQYNGNYQFIMDLSSGKLDTVAPAKNNFASPYKQLQADLLHLSWQIEQLSKGDYSQRVSFMGDFSHNMNQMIDALKEKQRISDLNSHYVEELKRLNATKDKFFSIISHDLKNPFAGIIGIINLLSDDLRDHNYKMLDSYVTILKEFSSQGYQLLVDLLEWSRLQTNSIVFNPEPMSLESTIDNAKAVILPAAQEKKIRISYTSEEDFTIIADANMLKTVTRNLLNNAVKFTPEGGKITIATRQKADYVTVEISDTGMGIKEKDLPKLFHIDSTFSTKGTNNETGTGLGLILCKEFINKMGGEISVTSKPGTGSTFSFTLPLAETLV